MAPRVMDVCQVRFPRILWCYSSGTESCAVLGRSRRVLSIDVLFRTHMVFCSRGNQVFFLSVPEVLHTVNYNYRFRRLLCVCVDYVSKHLFCVEVGGFITFVLGSITLCVIILMPVSPMPKEIDVARRCESKKVGHACD